jgi:hypothetical protein
MKKKTKRKCLRLALFLSIPLVFGSCATIISGTKQKITVTGNVTTPVQLLVDGENYPNVTLPAKVKIKRKNEMSKIIALAPDYKLEKQDVSKTFNHLVWANAAGTVLFPVFMYVDWKNGAYKKAMPNNINLEFTPANSEEDVFNSFINFGTECYVTDQLDNALYYYQLAYEIDSVNGIALQKMDEAYDRMSYLEEKARAKKAKTEMWMGILTVTGNLLQATGTTIQTVQSVKNGSSGGTVNSGATSSGSSGCNCASIQSRYSKVKQYIDSHEYTYVDAKVKEIVGIDNSGSNAVRKIEAGKQMRAYQQEKAQLEQKAIKCGCNLR